MRDFCFISFFESCFCLGWVASPACSLQARVVVPRAGMMQDLSHAIWTSIPPTPGYLYARQAVS